MIRREDRTPARPLADRINAAHNRAMKAAETAVEAAIECGQLLAQAKDKAGHGNWQTWLETNFAASPRTARDYMRLAAKAEKLERQHAASLTIRGALRQLAEPRVDTAPESPTLNDMAGAKPDLLGEVQALLPDITGAAWESFLADIDERGCMVPIELDENGRIIDGRQRDRACRQLGITPPSITRRGFTEEEKVTHCIQLNLLRGGSDINAVTETAGLIDAGLQEIMARWQRVAVRSRGVVNRIGANG